MKEKFNEYRIRTIFSSLLTLSPIIIGTILWDKIPNSLLPNSSITTNIDTPLYKILLVFGMPILMLIVNLICLTITYKDNDSKNQNRKIINSIFYICPSISIMCSIIFYNGILGNSLNISKYLPFLFGLFFIFFGNNMPKAKPNSTYGVKTYWALQNNENWIKTHRFSGVVWVIGGIYLLFLPMLPLNYIVPLLITTIVLLIILPISYSFIYYKKQVKSSNFKVDGVITKKFSKSQIIKSLIIVIIVFATLLTILCTGNIDTKLGSDNINITANYWTDIQIPYENINDIEYREQKKIGNRMNGFGSFKLSLGTFQNNEFNNYTCYMYNSTENCIVINTNDGTIIINAKSNNETIKLYYDLIQKLEINKGPIS